MLLFIYEEEQVCKKNIFNYFIKFSPATLASQANFTNETTAKQESEIKKDDEYLMQVITGLILSDGSLVKKYTGGGTYLKFAQSIISSKAGILCLYLNYFLI